MYIIVHSCYGMTPHIIFDENEAALSLAMIFSFPVNRSISVPMYQFISSLRWLWISVIPSPALSLFPCISGLANPTITHSQSSTNITIFIMSRNDKPDNNE